MNDLTWNEKYLLLIGTIFTIIVFLIMVTIYQPIKHPNREMHWYILMIPWNISTILIAIGRLLRY